MENFYLKETAKTPKIMADPTTGIIEIKGRSMPEDGPRFFGQFTQWLTTYQMFAPESTEVSFFLDYFNTSSSKCILDLFRQLEAIVQAGNTSGRVIWKFIEEDEDMEEAGEDYSSIVDVPFDLQEINP